MKKQLFLFSFFLFLLVSIGGFGLYRSHKSQQVHNIFDEIYYDEEDSYFNLLRLGYSTFSKLKGVDYFYNHAPEAYRHSVDYNDDLPDNLSMLSYFFYFDKEKPMYQKGDFTHQSITMATMLREGFQASDLLGAARGYGLDSREHTNDLAGWLGDTTKRAGNSISIRVDDYKSDLDAVNIIGRMKDSGKSYFETANDYYEGVKQYQQDIQSGKAPEDCQEINRAEEFKKYKPLDKIFEELQKGERKSLERNLTEDELKNLNPQGYQFFDDIRNGVTGDE